MVASSPMLAAVMGGMDPRHFLSGGMGALASDSNGVPFNGSWVVSSGNIASDMYSNVTAEATGRTLAARLYEATDDQGMKDMLAFLIARDTMHQQQWLAVIEELGGYEGNLPIPNSFPQEQEKRHVSYTFFKTSLDDLGTPQGRWTSGASLDGRSEFRAEAARPRPYGEGPELAPPVEAAHAQLSQIEPDALSNQEQEIEEVILKAKH
jgi:Mn-containing catalase